MGNCQVTEAAAVVIQHPGGRVERVYWPTSAGEVMRSNPGHHVALITLCSVDEEKRESGGSGAVRFTRVRLLKPKDTLVLGQVYRLVTSQEVNKALRARRYEKMKKAELIKKQQQQQQQQQQSRRMDHSQEAVEQGRQPDPENVDQVASQDRDRQRGAQSSVRARQWRPSLQSISEMGS